MNISSSIDEKGYAASLGQEGITDVMKFGYAFYAKKSAICRSAPTATMKMRQLPQ